jgi:hypothetical protein
MAKSNCSTEGCDLRVQARGLCSTHYWQLWRTGKLIRRTAGDRFWSKVDKSGDCWLWVASKNNRGYGQFVSVGRLVLAHRFSYELAKGPIPDGLTLDHLCRTPACVNPDHLEAVTMRVNLLRSESQAALNARKTHCTWGHPFAGDNLIVRHGKRFCRACNIRRCKERRT